MCFNLFGDDPPPTATKTKAISDGAAIHGDWVRVMGGCWNGKNCVWCNETKEIKSVERKQALG